MADHSHHPIPSPTAAAELAELQIDKDRWIGTEEAGPAFGMENKKWLKHFYSKLED